MANCLSRIAPTESTICYCQPLWAGSRLPVAQESFIENEEPEMSTEDAVGAGTTGAAGLTPAGVSAWPIVRRGDQNHPVRTLQQLLRAHSQGVAVDGVFGPATETAVRVIQQQRHLAIDGVVGANTWSALIIQVQRGSTGDAVRGVQEEFRFRNLSGNPGTGLALDGIFGTQTEAAVRGFQQALHTDIPSVTVDGIVGPVTWRALVSGMLSL
jgi:peptidoglycan hydrolase-like protein with peptidoglycan-binding domain